jgi:hypothetical protein
MGGLRGGLGSLALGRRVGHSLGRWVRRLALGSLVSGSRLGRGPRRASQGAGSRAVGGRQDLGRPAGSSRAPVGLTVLGSRPVRNRVLVVPLLANRLGPSRVRVVPTLGNRPVLSRVLVVPMLGNRLGPSRVLVDLLLVNRLGPSWVLVVPMLGNRPVLSRVVVSPGLVRLGLSRDSRPGRRRGRGGCLGSSRGRHLVVGRCPDSSLGHLLVVGRRRGSSRWGRLPSGTRGQGPGLGLRLRTNQVLSQGRSRSPGCSGLKGCRCPMWCRGRLGFGPRPRLGLTSRCLRVCSTKPR